MEAFAYDPKRQRVGTAPEGRVRLERPQTGLASATLRGASASTAPARSGGAAREDAPSEAAAGREGEAGSIRSMGDATALRICSDQVVVDLRSALKELVENALDAGATKIEVKLKEHGSEALEVWDNGAGIAQSDLPGVARRHHTSKLGGYGDLGKLTSFGFRGEALSSLAALSTLSVATRTRGDAAGTCLTFERDGSVASRATVPREVGTTVTVTRLFEPFAVRRRELIRTASAEVRKMLASLQAYALVCCHVRFSCSDLLTRGGRQLLLQTEGGVGGMRSAVSSIFGAKQLAELIPLSGSAAGISLHGFLSRPRAGYGRRQSDRQYLFVNQRPVDFPKLSRLVNDAFRQATAKSECFPFVLLNLKAPPDAYDVNVTPDKRTVLFTAEAAVLACVAGMIADIFATESCTFRVSAPVGTIGGVSAFPRAGGGGDGSDTEKHFGVEATGCADGTDGATTDTAGEEAEGVAAGAAGSDAPLGPDPAEDGVAAMGMCADGQGGGVTGGETGEGASSRVSRGRRREGGSPLTEPYAAQPAASGGGQGGGAVSAVRPESSGLRARAASRAAAPAAAPEACASGVTPLGSAAGGARRRSAHAAKENVPAAQPARRAAGRKRARQAGGECGAGRRTRAAGGQGRARGEEEGEESGEEEEGSREEEESGEEKEEGSGEEKEGEDDGQGGEEAAEGGHVEETQSETEEEEGEVGEEERGEVDKQESGKVDEEEKEEVDVSTGAHAARPTRARHATPTTGRELRREPRAPRTGGAAEEESAGGGAAAVATEPTALAEDPPSAAASPVLPQSSSAARLDSDTLVSSLFSQLRAMQEEADEADQSPLQTMQLALRIFSQQAAALPPARIVAPPPAGGAAPDSLLCTLVVCATRYCKGWLALHAGPTGLTELDLAPALAACGFDWEAEAFDGNPDHEALSDAFDQLACAVLARLPRDAGGPPQSAAPRRRSRAVGSSGGLGGDGPSDVHGTEPLPSAEASPLPPLLIARDVVVAFDMMSFSAQYERTCIGGRGAPEPPAADAAPPAAAGAGGGAAEPLGPEAAASAVPSAGNLDRAARVAGGTLEGELRRVLPKEAFRAMQVLGQFNLGFLVARRGSDLFIVDQHAADEKARFEALQKSTMLHTQRLISPLPLHLTAVDELTVIDHLPAFKANGFEVQVQPDAPPTERLRLLTLPFSRHTVFGVRDVHELVALLAEAPGGQPRLPKLRDMFASRACRSAVMIGTALEQHKMRTIVAQLAELEQPWNCPHGRPTLRHLIDLTSLARTRAATGFKSLK